jgi:hypothetical protein
MPRDVTTRWNSTFDMLDFAIEYRKALQLTTSNLDLNLRQYELSREEWATAQQLREVLKVCAWFVSITVVSNEYFKVFKDATTFFSQSKPNIDSVIPAMDYIDQQLTNSALDPKYSLSIKTAISLGKRTLNRYYDMTNHSEIYRIAMGEFDLTFLLHGSHYFNVVLHPRHKLDYFKKAGWSDEWIATARTIVRDEFEWSYAEPLAEDSQVESVVCHIGCSTSITPTNLSNI